MIYEIILVNGNVLQCWTENIEDVLDMMLNHDIFIVQENGYPQQSTYIMPDKVSHYRFPQNVEGVAKPI